MENLTNVYTLSNLQLNEGQLALLIADFYKGNLPTRGATPKQGKG